MTLSYLSINNTFGVTPHHDYRKFGKKKAVVLNAVCVEPSKFHENEGTRRVVGAFWSSQADTSIKLYMKILIDTFCVQKYMSGKKPLLNLAIGPQK